MATGVLFAVGIWFYARPRAPMAPWSPPNILVISTCSLRVGHLAAYGSPRDYSPNITQWAADGTFVFDRTFTEMSWSNLSGFIGAEGPAMLARYGYRGIRTEAGQFDPKLSKFEEEERLPYFFRFHFFREMARSGGSINDEVIARAFASFERKVRDPDPRPFFTQLHLKFLHMPYGWGGKENRDKIFASMQPANVARLQEYFLNFLKYPDKLPLMVMALPDRLIVEFLKHHPARNSPAIRSVLTKTDRRQYVGLTQNADFLLRWRKSEGYAEDVAMLRDFYGGRLAWYDQKVASILNVFDDPELQKKTVVIYMGDHGESLMEHDQAAHGGIPYDELIHIPLIVRFPGASGAVSRHLPAQFSIRSVVPLIDGIMSGKIRAENLEQWVKEIPGNEFLFSRDCGNGVHAVRWKNEWKMIHFLGQDTRRLYHLSQDPGETQDVLAQYPEVAARLEEELDAYSGGEAERHACVSALNEQMD